MQPVDQGSIGLAGTAEMLQSVNTDSAVIREAINIMVDRVMHLEDDVERKNLLGNEL